jgi:hypothetical protein
VLDWLRVQSSDESVQHSKHGFTVFAECREGEWLTVDNQLRKMLVWRAVLLVVCKQNKQCLIRNAYRLSIGRSREIPLDTSYHFHFTS